MASDNDSSIPIDELSDAYARWSGQNAAIRARDESPVMGTSRLEAAILSVLEEDEARTEAMLLCPTEAMPESCVAPDTAPLIHQGASSELHFHFGNKASWVALGIVIGALAVTACVALFAFAAAPGLS